MFVILNSIDFDEVGNRASEGGRPHFGRPLTSYLIEEMLCPSSSNEGTLFGSQQKPGVPAPGFVVSAYKRRILLDFFRAASRFPPDCYGRGEVRSNKSIAKDSPLDGQDFRRPIAKSPK